ncbi:serine hydrolase domain-containing protein [Sedimentibacter sp.]|uniref:serine hydrolase domain-containing protein n=1 Tax=Sedimentibacter sp. TaxID=1960295 RepID=UPI0028A151AE|nr:serine hydrolase domain-containing protein [Sedimentibacter sp.]
MKKIIYRNYITLVLIFAVLIFLITFNGCSKDVSNTNIELNKKLDEYVNAFNEAYSSHKINGSIVISKSGRIVASGNYGMADLENNIVFTQDTRSLLCSTTKLFTAIGIMQLNEKGLLSVDDNVSKYIPDQYRGDDITIQHLLTHTSGISRDITDSGLINPYQNTSKEKLISLVNDISLNFEPGKKFLYSNAGYQLLACIIEKASDMSFEEYIRKNIFEPAGMKNSGLSFFDDDIDNLAAGYEYKFNNFIKKPPYDMSHTYGSGNIYTTSNDMYLFDKALREEKLLKKETLNKMICDNTGMGINYGYGCVVGNMKDHIWFGQPGNLNSGYFSYYVRFPEEDTAIIILLNTIWNDNNSIMKAISAIALEEEYTMPYERQEIKPDEAMLNKFTGKYEASDDNINDIMTVKHENGHLVVSVSNQKIYLTPCSETEFFDKTNEMWEHVFETDAYGNITGYILIDPVDEIKFKRVE